MPPSGFHRARGDTSDAYALSMTDRIASRVQIAPYSPVSASSRRFGVDVRYDVADLVK